MSRRLRTPTASFDGFPADARSGRIPAAECQVTDRIYSVVTNADTTSCRTLKPRSAIRHERFVILPQLGQTIYEWKINAQSAGHDAAVADKLPLNSTSTSLTHQPAKKRRHDARFLFYLFPSPRRTIGSDVGSIYSIQTGKPGRRGNAAAQNPVEDYPNCPVRRYSHRPIHRLC